MAAPAELASELRRFLQDEPILARPVTASTFLAVVTPQSRIAGLMLAMVLSLLFGIGFSTYFAILADVQLREPQKNEHRATQAQAAAQGEAEKAAASRVQAKHERNAAEEAKKRAEGLRELGRRQLEAAAPRAYLGDMQGPARLAELYRAAAGDSASTRPEACGEPHSDRSTGLGMVFPAGLERTKRTCARGENVIRRSRRMESRRKMAGFRFLGQPAKGRHHPHLECFDRKLYRPLRGHKAPATAIAWHQAEMVSPPGTRTAMSSYGIARQGDTLRTLNRGNAPIPALCYSPAGDMLAAAVGDRVCVWNPATGEFRKSLAGHARAVRRIKWNASGKLLATSVSLTRSESGIWRATNPSKSSNIRRAGPLVPGRRLLRAWRMEKRLPGNRRELSVGRRSKTRQNGRKSVRTTRWAHMIWNSARTAITWLRLVPRRSASGTRAGESRLPDHPERSGWARRLCSAAPGRARNARAILVFDVTEGRTAGIFDGHLAEIYSLHRRVGAGLLPPGPIAPCGCGR